MRWRWFQNVHVAVGATRLVSPEPHPGSSGRGGLRNCGGHVQTELKDDKLAQPEEPTEGTVAFFLRKSDSSVGHQHLVQQADPLPNATEQP